MILIGRHLKSIIQSDSSWELDRKRQYRESKLREFVESINSENSKKWLQRIIRCSETQSNNQATFIYFVPFLELFSENHPDLAFILLKEHDSEMLRFLAAILCGLLRSKSRKQAYDFLSKWVEDGENIFSCARLFEFDKDLDVDLLRRIFDKAKMLGDKNTLIKVMSGIVINYDENKKPLIKELFLPAIEELTKSKDARWILDIWFRKELKAVLFDKENLVL